jgi:hypothetical protein
MKKFSDYVFTSEANANDQYDQVVRAFERLGMKAKRVKSNGLIEFQYKKHEFTIKTDGWNECEFEIKGDGKQKHAFAAVLKQFFDSVDKIVTPDNESGPDDFD